MNMKFINFVTLLLFLSLNNLYSKELSFIGLQKLNTDDLQTLSSIDLSKSGYNLDEINSIIKDLYNSDLISDINLEILDDLYSIKIIEAK